MVYISNVYAHFCGDFYVVIYIIVIYDVFTPTFSVIIFVS